MRFLYSTCTRFTLDPVVVYATPVSCRRTETRQNLVDRKKCMYYRTVRYYRQELIRSIAYARTWEVWGRDTERPPPRAMRLIPRNRRALLLVAISITVLYAL